MTSTDITKLSQEYAELARSLAQRAGERVKEMREQNVFKVSLKSLRNPVTEADLEAEAIILGEIRRRYPSHLILSEESSSSITPQAIREHTVWIVDPIDGTVNYARNHLQVAVSVAVAVTGQLYAGAVYSPFQQELFSAARGCGALLNDRPIAVRAVTDLTDSLIATGFPYERTNVADLLGRINKVLINCQDIRRNGAAALDICWVACGRLDAYYEDVKCWDMAAGMLIAREAGALQGNFRGSESEWPEELRPDGLIVSAPGILGKLQDLLR